MNTKIKKLLIGASLLTAFTFANAKSTESQVRCLATAIYHEANNQTLAGKNKIRIYRKTQNRNRFSC